MIKLGAIADCFTDAASFGMSLAKEGSRTAVIFHAASIKEEQAFGKFDVVSVSVNRNCSLEDDISRRYRTTANTLKESGVQQIALKIDPVSDREIIMKINAVLGVLGKDSVAVVVPSEGRNMQNIEDEAPEWTAEQKIGFIDAMDPNQKKEQIKSALTQARSENHRILVLNVTNENMEEAARAVSELDWNVLFVDSGAFSAKVAHRKGWISNTAPVTEGAVIPKEVGTALVLDGNASPAAQRQMEVLFAHSDVDHIAVNTGLLMKPDENAEYEIKRITNCVADAIQSERPPRIMVVDTALCGKVLDLTVEDNKNQLQSGTCESNIKNSIGRIATKIIHDTAEKLIGIYLTGDETITAVCSHLGVKAIELSDSVLPQAAFGHLIGDGPKLPIIWNKGGTENEYTAEDLVNHLFFTA